MDLSFPKMKIESILQYKNILTKLGVKMIFEEKNCNFRSGFKEPKYIEDILHSCRITFDEEFFKESFENNLDLNGARNKQVLSEVSLNLNRPFMLIVYHRILKIPLIMSVVIDPE